MNKTSSVATGSATMTAAAIAPLVEWLANKVWNWGMPPQVVLLVAAGLVTVGHFIVNLMNAKLEEAEAEAAIEMARVVPTTVTTQAGFAQIGVLFGYAIASLAFLTACCLALSGCAGVNQFIAAKEKSSIVAVQSANDNLIDGLHASICEVPYGAIIRHPEFVTVAMAACLPAGPASSANNLLPAPVAQPVGPVNYQPAPVSAPTMPTIMAPTPIIAPTVKTQAKPKPLAFKPAPAPVIVPQAVAPTPAVVPVAKPAPIAPEPSSLLSPPVIPK